MSKELKNYADLVDEAVKDLDFEMQLTEKVLDKYKYDGYSKENPDILLKAVAIVSTKVDTAYLIYGKKEE